MNRLGFTVMTFIFSIRDRFIPPERVLEEVGIEPGDTVLDYGTGPGTYAITAAKIVGESGSVRAVDISPHAVARVRRLAKRLRLANVTAVQSDCATGLADGSVDVVLLYDILHFLGDAKEILRELHRVLRPGGRLSVSDHHMKEADILARIASDGLFTLSHSKTRSHIFMRAG